MARYVQENADRDEKRHERRASVAYERQRDSRKRNDVEVYPHVHERLHENPGYDSDGDVFRERIVHSSRDTESPVRYVTVAGDEEGYSNESELFGDHRENEVPLNFREISEFLD